MEELAEEERHKWPLKQIQQRLTTQLPTTLELVQTTLLPLRSLSLLQLPYSPLLLLKAKHFCQGI